VKTRRGKKGGIWEIVLHKGEKKEVRLQNGNKKRKLDQRRGRQPRRASYLTGERARVVGQRGMRRPGPPGNEGWGGERKV